MDRRELINKGVWSMVLWPFAIKDIELRPVKELPTEKTRYCDHCGKEVAWKEVTLLDTTAHTPHRNERTYLAAGVITFHTDGTRCSEECIKIEVLDNRVVHKNFGGG